MTPEAQRWRDSGLFVPYRGVAYDPDRGDPKAWEFTEDYIERCVASGEPRGVVFIGPPGTGKTLLAHHIMAAALDVGWEVRALAMSAFMDMLSTRMDLMTLVNRFGNEEAGRKVMSIINTTRRLEGDYRYVLLDDLGKEHATESGWVRTRFDRLIRARGNRGLPTIITTNLPLSAWDDRYGPEMSSYIHQVADIVPVTAPDVRRSRAGR